MQLAVSLSRENVRRGGGPLGAAAIDMDSYQPIAPGVNLVVPTNCSAAYSEMVAIMVAQQVVGAIESILLLQQWSSLCAKLTGDGEL